MNNKKRTILLTIISIIMFAILVLVLPSLSLKIYNNVVDMKNNIGANKKILRKQINLLLKK